MHTALYRKYRPKTFSQVVGQKYIVQALKNQVDSGNIGHAFLFTGTRGTGKTSCAKIFAKAINCLNPHGGEPCLECDICKGIENESIYDVSEMDAASNNSVEDIRDVLDEVMYLPVMAKYRVYIIDEVHMLSASAFNALLKTLEEPPPHVIFILATTELHKVPATILSRCQRYDFTKLSIEEIGDALLDIAKSEDISLSPGAAKTIASLADGAMRDAISILDTCLSLNTVIDDELVANVVGISKDEELLTLTKALVDRDMPLALQNLLTLEQRSVDMKRLCEEIITHFKNLLLANLSGSTPQLLNIPKTKFEDIKAQANTTDQAFISHALSCFTAALEAMSKGQNTKIAMDIAVYTLCAQIVQPNVYREQPARATPPKTPMKEAQAPLVQNEGEDKAPKAKKEAPKPILQPEIVQGEVPVSFTYWDKVIDVIGDVDIPFHSFIKNSKAWLFENVVYIDGSEGLNNYIRTNKEAGNIVKKAILQVCGRSYNIGGYRNIAKKFEIAQKDSLNDIIALRDSGVQVNIKD
ncbi:MAG: DNA polymerase III subunit gamma/tau [Oscillospiraceae bacterium]